MEDRDERRFDRGTRVQTFVEENSADFSGNQIVAEELGKLDGYIDDINAARVGQTPNRVSKSTLRDALKLDLQNVARTARSIELRDNENGFATCYRLPNVPTEKAVTTLADAVLARLEDQEKDSAATKTAKTALRARFTSYGLPADFVAHIRTDRNAITEATKHNQTENFDGVENTQLISELLEKVSETVMHLDAVARNVYSRQPEKLKAWLSASHVERTPQREKKTEAAAAKPAASAPQ